MMSTLLKLMSMGIQSDRNPLVVALRVENANIYGIDKDDRMIEIIPGYTTLIVEEKPTKDLPCGNSVVKDVSSSEVQLFLELLRLQSYKYPSKSFSL